jgi:hypothetical protein
MATQSYSARVLILSVVFSVIAAATLGILLSRLYPRLLGNEPAIIETSDQTRFENCLERTKSLGKPDDLRSYEAEWRLCGNEVYNLMLFTDFEIRRNKFVRQEFDERVNLWLVVGITISGVILAAFQLVLSYRLATIGKGEFGAAQNTTVGAEQGRISLQSSVIGLVILFISLAFFFVYVKWIYTAPEFQIERPDNLKSPSVQLNLAGGLGPPPSPATPQPQSSTPKQNTPTP